MIAGDLFASTGLLSILKGSAAMEELAKMAELGAASDRRQICEQGIQGFKDLRMLMQGSSISCLNSLQAAVNSFEKGFLNQPMMAHPGGRNIKEGASLRLAFLRQQHGLSNDLDHLLQEHQQ